MKWCLKHRRSRTRRRAARRHVGSSYLVARARRGAGVTVGLRPVPLPLCARARATATMPRDNGRLTPACTAFRHWPSAPPHVATTQCPFLSPGRPRRYRATASACSRAYKNPYPFSLVRPSQPPPPAISAVGELAFSLAPMTNL
jgi:hypothetical protein